MLAPMSPLAQYGGVKESTTAPQELITMLAQRLLDAERSTIAVEPISAEFAELTIDDAYRIQKAAMGQHFASGAHRVGHKIGLTSQAIQNQLGVNQPDFGVITDRMVLPNRGRLAVSDLIAPRLEAEYAFRIAKDLPVLPTREELVEAIDGVAVALEVIDSRIVDWRITLIDTVADNASSARVVVGEWVDATSQLLDSLPGREISLSRDNEEVSAGPGSAVLGDPINSVFWLAQAIGEYGDNFRAGEFVIAGAVSAAVPLVPGMQWSAQSNGFPRVKLGSV